MLLMLSRFYAYVLVTRANNPMHVPPRKKSQNEKELTPTENLKKKRAYPQNIVQNTITTVNIVFYRPNHAYILRHVILSFTVAKV